MSASSSSSFSYASFFGFVEVHPEDWQSIAEPGSLVRTPVVSFVAEYCNQQQRTALTSSSSSIPVLYLDPSVVQAMIGFDDVSIGPSEDMNLAQMLVFPLTTHVGTNHVADGGHWSLVILLRAQCDGEQKETATTVVLCADSHGQCNRAASAAFVDLLCRSSSSSASGPSSPWYTQLRGKDGRPPALTYCKGFPQQDNCFDCGVWLCFGMLKLLEVWFGGRIVDGVQTTDSAVASIQALACASPASWLLQSLCIGNDNTSQRPSHVVARHIRSYIVHEMRSLAASSSSSS